MTYITSQFRHVMALEHPFSRIHNNYGQKRVKNSGKGGKLLRKLDVKFPISN